MIFSDITNNIIIANGFFNPKYLNLYNENNRVKKIKIKLLDVNSEIIADLKDTYNLQMIKLPKKSKKFEIEILEIYKGTKYSDTSISGLFTNYKMAMKEK